ncbi:hypothetical protein VTK56DRAFT_2752 [Thermocarpiscus australiensis]
MADVEQQQGGPRTSRRSKHAGKSKAQPANDWPRSGEPRARASPRPRRHGDIDMDIVETSDDANDASETKFLTKKQRRRRRRQAPSSTDSDATTPAKTPQRLPADGSSSMRVPNASMSVLATAPTRSHHRRPTYELEEDEDDDAAPSGPSRPVSRQTVSRRNTSPRSTHRYRSTPESRRSPRTSVSDSEDDTEDTSDSDEEQVIQPHNKHLPPAPVAPAVPPAPPAPAVHSSLQERLKRRPEMVYEEPDSTSRYAPSVGRHRSLSRAPSSRRDHYRRPKDITVSRAPSVDEVLSRSRSRSRRPSRRHYESDIYDPRPSSSFTRSHAAAESHFAPSHSPGSAFGLAASSGHPSYAEKPVKRVTTCIVCRNDNTPVEKTAKLKCRHRMCHSCLRKVFRLSIRDPQHMPPRCCTTDPIPLKHVESLFDAAFKREWNYKFWEYSTRNRLYCPSRHCGEWIKPEDIRREGGRRHGKCSRCRTKVCGSCGGWWHHQPDCPRDEETTQFLEQAKREGWQRCHRCKAPIEIKEGCNHMTCRCGAEFCIICGGKWKTCQCPWFKYDPFEGDAMVDHAHGPMSPRLNPFASAPPYDAVSPSAREFRPEFGAPPVTARPRPSSYEEEAYLRQLQEQRDEHLARRMHSLDAFGHHGGHADFGPSRDEYQFDDPREPRSRAERRARGAAYLDDDDYHRRPATVVAPSPPQTHVPAAPPPPHSAFEPPSRPAFDRPAFDRSASVFDYDPAIHRNRGMRYASPERYDDYMTENYAPDRRRRPSPDGWAPFSREQRPRSPDRRHAYRPESRPLSPETWQLPTRYPSPERPVPATEERRRAPSPDRRRASSLERRLAERFNSDSRQSPAAPVAPVGPVGPVSPLGPGGPLGPLSPTRGPPLPPRAATHPIAPGMPMAPVSPPGIHSAPPAPHTLRRHTMDEDVYGPGLHAGLIPAAADWFGPPAAGGGGGLGATHHMRDAENVNVMSGGSPRAPHVKRRPPGQAHREHSKYEVAMPRSSVLAGLGGIGRGMHRVSEWVNYIEPGVPPEGGEQTPTVVQ